MRILKQNSRTIFCLICMLILAGCEKKEQKTYKVKILDINSLHIVIPDLSLQSVDVLLLNQVIKKIKQKVFINRSGKNLKMKLLVIEFKPPIEDTLPYFMKFSFAGRGPVEEYVITGTYNVKDIDMEDQESVKTLIGEIADYISNKVIGYLNQAYGFQHSDTFEDAFITYNKESGYGRAQGGLADTGVYVTWEQERQRSSL